MKVYLGVGSNLGDRVGYIQQSQKKLEDNSIRVLRVSKLYETEALCKPGETMPAFMNGVFEIETTLSPHDLLKVLQKIEKELGRENKGDWKPRPIDLDILLYGDLTIDTPDLKIPHPEMNNREFVLKPLSNLLPDFRRNLFDGMPKRV